SGEHASVARNQPAVLAHQRRRRPAPLLDARRDRRDLGVRVGAGIFRIRDQPVDRPPLDLVGRPRPLISGLDSRAGARAPREGGSVGAFTHRSTLSAGALWIPADASPRSANRAGAVASVNAAGSQSATSSHSRGIDTRASGVGRTDQTEATVRSLAFWL